MLKNNNQVVQRMKTSKLYNYNWMNYLYLIQQKLKIQIQIKQQLIFSHVLKTIYFTS